jgi:hypothetical protein
VHEANAWGALAEATAAALAGPARISDPVLSRDLEVRLARWWEAAGGNKAVERLRWRWRGRGPGAGGARRWALGSGDGFAASEPDILRRLAGIQRTQARAGAGRDAAAAGGPDPADLDPLREAAAVALESRSRRKPLRGIALGRLLDQATRLLRAGQTPAARPPPTRRWRSPRWRWPIWNRGGRSQRLVAGGGSGAGLHPAAAAQGRRPQAADASGGPGHGQAARPARRHPGRPPDGGRRRQRRAGAGPAGQLYEEEKRLPELLALRQEELARTQKVERRLGLRLEMEKLAAALEERSGRWTC